MLWSKLLKLALVAGTCGLFAGCTSGATGTVEGTVYVDGEPMGGFEVSYKSDEDGSVAMGASQSDGRYKLFIGRANKRIRTGRYHVTLEPSGMITGVPRPTVRLPARYLDFSQTDLVQTVDSGSNVLDLHVETR
jgi:hypothetical protein